MRQKQRQRERKRERQTDRQTDRQTQLKTDVSGSILQLHLHHLNSWVIKKQQFDSSQHKRPFQYKQGLVLPCLNIILFGSVCNHILLTKQKRLLSGYFKKQSILCFKENMIFTGHPVECCCLLKFD